MLLTPQFWIVAAIALALSCFGGCRWQAHNDAAEIAHAELQRDVYKADANTLAGTLDEVNAKADQAKRDAADQAKNAVDAVKQADKDRAEFDKKLGSVEDALERAKRSPTCRVQLETESCAAFN